MNATPVITDFRMGFTKDQLDVPEKMENLFPPYEDSDVWPIEVFVISRLLNINESADEQNQTEPFFTEQMANDFIQQYTQMSLFSNSTATTLQTKKDEFITNMQMYFQPLHNKPNKDVIEALKQTVLSWDVFSLTTIFLNIFRELEIDTLKETHGFIQKYSAVLEEYNLFDPIKRPSIETVLQKIQTVFQSISIEEYRAFLNDLLKTTS
jgi:hypothetical protein